MPLQFHALEGVLEYLERLHHVPSTDRLRRSLLARPNSDMRRLEQTFLEYIEPPGDLPISPSSLLEREILQLSEYMPGLRSKSEVSSTVSLQLTGHFIPFNYN